jgi:hypothetical protein
MAVLGGLRYHHDVVPAGARHGDWRKQARWRAKGKALSSVSVEELGIVSF